MNFKNRDNECSFRSEKNIYILNKRKEIAKKISCELSLEIQGCHGQGKIREINNNYVQDLEN